LTNPVTGTGTSGQVAYFTGTSAISSESNLFWDATNDRLGIGTNIPAYNLSIVGGTSAAVVSGFQNTSSAGYSGAHFLNNSGTQMGHIGYANASTGATLQDVIFIGSIASKSVLFTTADTIKMALFANGNLGLGVGTTDAGFKLDVNGTGRFSGALNGTSASFSGPVVFTGTTIGLGSQRWIGSDGGAGLYLNTPSSTNINFAINYITSLALTSTGAATFNLGSGEMKLNRTGTSEFLKLNTYYILTDGNDQLLGSVTGATSIYAGNGVSPRVYINTSGSVGINTTSPTEILHLNKTSGTGTFIRFQDTAGGGVYIGGRSESMEFYSGNAEAMRLTSGRNLLINTSTVSSASLNPNGTLQVKNEIISVGASSGIFWENRAGGVTSSSNWYGWYTSAGTIFLYNGSANAASINPSTGIYTPLSDKNKKKDFEQSTLGLNEILNLKPTLYRMNNDSQYKEKQLGFLAQEVKEYIPQAYVECEDFIGLNYNSIIPVLVNAIKELKQEINTLKI
jgi:hypothetical protein